MSAGRARPPPTMTCRGRGKHRRLAAHSTELPVLPHRRTPFERIALLLQGGGALGAYQGGRLSGSGRSGPASRLGRRHLDRCDQFRDHRRQSAGKARRAPARLLGDRERVAAGTFPMSTPIANARRVHIISWSISCSALNILMLGAPGFLRSARAACVRCGRAGNAVKPRATTTIRRLRATLERLVDFDRINRGRYAL